MSEMGGSYDPGEWRGYSHDAARKAHNDKAKLTAGRAYTSPGSTPAIGKDCVPEEISTDSPSPLAIVCDGTGSMGAFPSAILGKMPLLDNAGVEDYLPEAQISFAMVGDAAAGDAYPLQVTKFERGLDMAKSVNDLVIEGRGGGNVVESYDLAALYYLHNAKIPKAIKPVLIFICDEGIPALVDKEHAKLYAKVDLGEKKLTRAQLFKQLRAKFSVFCIRKHYNQVDSDTLTGENKTIHEEWVKLLGPDRVCILNDPNRVVDLILGLLAIESGKMAEFTEEINHRQTKAQVKTVMKSLEMVTLPIDKDDGGGKSIMTTDDKNAKLSKPLI